MNAQTTLSAAIPFAVPTSRWNDTHAATLSPAELLLYRSNLLGSDLTVTNFGGGNTSAKLTEIDPLTGEAVEVLWVKGQREEALRVWREGRQRDAGNEVLRETLQRLRAEP